MIHPLIEADGTITEADIDGRAYCYLRAKQVKRGAWAMSFEREEFRREEYAFSLRGGKQIALLRVYVHEDFAREFKDDARKCAVESFVRDNAAYLFTYAERIKRE